MLIGLYTIADRTLFMISKVNIIIEDCFQNFRNLSNNDLDSKAINNMIEFYNIMGKGRCDFVRFFDRIVSWLTTQPLDNPDNANIAVKVLTWAGNIYGWKTEHDDETYDMILNTPVSKLIQKLHRDDKNKFLSYYSQEDKEHFFATSLAGHLRCNNMIEDYQITDQYKDFEPSRDVAIHRIGILERLLRLSTHFQSYSKFVNN